MLCGSQYFRDDKEVIIQNEGVELGLEKQTCSYQLTVTHDPCDYIQHNTTAYIRVASGFIYLSMTILNLFRYTN